MDVQHIQSIPGKSVIDSNNDTVGDAGQVYLNDVTDQPEWVTVKTGLFGSKESFVPLVGSQVTGAGVVVAYPKDVIKDAPRIDADGHLSESEIDQLYRHYQVEGAQTQAADITSVDDQETSGGRTDSAMTLSEERLHVGTEKRETGRVRLRKYVVTKNVTQTVPVTHEEVRLEREPITDSGGDPAVGGAEIGADEQEVVLTEERVVTSKEAVPVERVKLSTESVTEDRDVTEEVRSERIETDGDVDVRDAETAPGAADRD